jgi:hypothetical protein
MAKHMPLPQSGDKGLVFGLVAEADIARVEVDHGCTCLVAARRIHEDDSDLVAVTIRVRAVEVNHLVDPVSDPIAVATQLVEDLPEGQRLSRFPVVEIYVLNRFVQNGRPPLEAAPQSGEVLEQLAVQRVAQRSQELLGPGVSGALGLYEQLAGIGVQACANPEVGIKGGLQPAKPHRSEAQLPVGEGHRFHPEVDGHHLEKEIPTRTGGRRTGPGQAGQPVTAGAHEGQHPSLLSLGRRGAGTFVLAIVHLHTASSRTMSLDSPGVAPTRATSLGSRCLIGLAFP